MACRKTQTAHHCRHFALYLQPGAPHNSAQEKPLDCLEGACRYVSTVQTLLDTSQRCTLASGHLCQGMLLCNVASKNDKLHLSRLSQHPALCLHKVSELLSW